MSTPSATKFTDHYAVLGVEPDAPSEVIAAAYQSLAKRFHPSTPVTCDPQKFAEVTEAYDTLADPNSREAFDEMRKKNMVDTTPPAFTGPPFFAAFEGETARRTTVLCVLYDRRRQKPFTPSLSMRQIEAIIRITPEDLNFAIWYLKQRGFVVSDDKSSLQVTIAGMEHLEQNLPKYEDIELYLRTQEEFEAMTAKERRPGAAKPADSAKPAEAPRPAHNGKGAEAPKPAGASDGKGDYANSGAQSLASMLRRSGSGTQARR